MPTVGVNNYEHRPQKYLLRITMIIIGFSTQTSKILPRILCRHFRHVAPIGVDGTNITMYQFVRHGHIVPIHMRMRDIKTLARFGWAFVYMPGDIAPQFIDTYKHARTCVELTKHALRIHAPYVQTPDRLYQYINK